jgi:hypothetical protein
MLTCLSCGSHDVVETADPAVVYECPVCGDPVAGAAATNDPDVGMVHRTCALLPSSVPAALGVPAEADVPPPANPAAADADIPAQVTPDATAEPPAAPAEAPEAPVAAYTPEAAPVVEDDPWANVRKPVAETGDGAPATA